MQFQPLDQPLPWSIWKLIIQDQYVNFKKLFAVTDPSYDHNDEAKDFGNGFALVKKDYAIAKSPFGVRLTGCGFLTHGEMVYSFFIPIVVRS